VSSGDLTGDTSPEADLLTDGDTDESDDINHVHVLFIIFVTSSYTLPACVLNFTLNCIFSFNNCFTF